MALLTSFARWTYDNPTLSWSMRHRMRGRVAYHALFYYLAILTVTVGATYFWWLQKASTEGDYSRLSEVGVLLERAIFITQAALAFLITPSLTSGAISVERERRTFDTLLVSKLSVGEIAIGKLLSGVAFSAFLMAMALPFHVITLSIANISLLQAAQTYLWLLAGAVLMGSLGLMWSSASRTTAQATVMTYLSGLAIAFVSFVCGEFLFNNSDAMSSGISSTDGLECLGMNWFGNRWMGLQVPAGTGFILNSLLLSACFLSIAIARMDMRPVRKFRAARSWFALFLSVQLFSMNRLLVPWLKVSHDPDNSTLPSGLAVLEYYPMLALSFILVLAPMVCTGQLSRIEARRGSGWFKRGYTYAGFADAEFNSGPAYMMMLVLLGIALVPLSGLNVTRDGLSAWAISGTVMLAFAYGGGRLCQLASVLFKHRASACVLSLAALIILAVWPQSVAYEINRQSIPAFEGVAALSFMSPPTVIAYLAGWTHLAVSIYGLPIPLACIIAWIAIGLGCNSLISLSLRHQATSPDP